MSFDSTKEKPSGDDPLSGLAGVLGVKLKLHVTPQRIVDKVEGADDLAKKAASGPGGAIAAKMVQESLGEDFIKQTFEGQFVLPKRPVDIGDTWQSDVSQNLGGVKIKSKIDSKLTRLVEARGHIVAQIEFTGDGKLDGNGPPGVKFDLDQLTQKGTKEFDIDGGYFTRIEMDQKLKGDISASSPMGDIKLKLAQTLKEKIIVTPGRN